MEMKERALKRIYGTSLILLFSIFSVFGQEIEVTGRVTDVTDDIPLPGVNVIEKGTVNGAVTDMEGRYTITLSSTDAVLLFSFVGYVSEEIAVAGRTVVNVDMQSDVKGLEEVVVVGYGTQKKSDLTGAVTKVASEDLQELSTINVAQALQGRAAGVHITQTSGAPGAGMQIRIRGVTSIANSDPLFVVDGFPTGNISNIAPSDIESMEILKDASAQAIYGSRAAAGVILITTKRGKAGATTVTFETNVGIQEVWKQVDLPNATDYAIMYMEQFTNDGISIPNPNYMSRQVYEVLKFVADGNYEGTDWQSEIFRPALQQNYNLTINGGNEKDRFNFSTIYSDQQGIQKNSSLNKIMIRANSDHNVNKWLTFGTNIAFTRGIQKSSNAIFDAIKRNPIAPVFNQDGSWNSPIPDTGPSHPVRVLDFAQYRWPLSHRFAGSGYGEIKILEGLKFRSQFSYDMGSSESRSYSPEFWVTSLESNNRSSVTESRSQSWGWVWTNYLSYDKSLDEHNINLTAGTEAQYGYGYSMNSQSFDQPDIPSMYYLNSAPELDSAKVSPNRAYPPFPYESAMNSYFLRGNYSFQGKYLLTATVRWDGSSKFAAGYKWGMFPSFSAGWNIKREDFMQNIEFLNSLKIRGGWGQVGNSESVGSFEYLTSIVGNQKYVFNNVVVEGQAVDKLGNLEIQWETAEQTNIGFDGGMFRNMFNFTFDYFVRTTLGMLYDLPTPYFAGAAGSKANLASMENRGWEFSLNYRNYESRFRYEAGLNFSTYRNNVLALDKEGGNQEGGLLWSTGQNSTLTRPGDEMAFFYVIPTDGVFQTQEEIDNYAYIDYRGNAVPIQPNAQPGDMKFIDVNGDGAINNNDRIKVGSPHPDFHFGFNLGFEYSNFYFSTFIQGVYGNEIINGRPTYNRINRWREDLPHPTEPRLTHLNLNDNFRLSDFYLEDGSYIRVRNIQFGYNIPDKVLSVTGLKRMRAYISLDNIFTFTNYSGPEPEVVNGWYGHPLAGGIDAGVYPQSKTYSVGLSVTF
jgi:TonB-dependent starch-binding outer membrane protein SusC